MSAREILTDIAKELTEHPERWGQGALCADANGEPVGFDDPTITKCCLWGHVIKRARSPCTTYGPFLIERREARELFEKAVGAADIWRWNDRPERTVEEVVGACHKAAALEEAA